MQERKLKLSFKDKNGKTKVISLDYPKTDLDDQIVKEKMEEIINSKVLRTKEDMVDTINKAYIENISKENFNVE